MSPTGKSVTDDVDGDSAKPLEQAIQEGRLGRDQLGAWSTPNQPALSISGNSAVRPERGGHSIVNVLLRTAAASISPWAAQALTILPPFWRTLPSSISSLTGSAAPVSSSNSSQRAFARIFAVVVLALRDRPRAGVAARPEWPAGVHEQHLGRWPGGPVEENAGAPLLPPSGRQPVRGLGRRGAVGRYRDGGIRLAP